MSARNSALLEQVWNRGQDRPAPPAAIRAPLLRQAMQLRPDDVQTGLRYLNVLVELDRSVEAAAVLDALEARFPDNGDVHVQRAQALCRAGGFDAALAACERALSLAREAGDRDRLERDLPLAAERLGGWGDPAGLARAVLESDPQLLTRLYEDSRRHGRMEDFVRVCDALLKAAPGHTEAVYHKGLALGLLGRTYEARAAISIDRAIAVRDLPPPPGYDPDAFFEALEFEILSNPSLSADLWGNATEQGLRTHDNLRLGDVTALPALLDMLKASALEHAHQHPDLKRRLDGKPPRFGAWAVVCGSKGRQRSHRHPRGVVSGVFYVAGPPGPDGGYLGPLLLGEVEPMDAPAPWGVREVEPKPGRVVLFPSYMPHATAASGADHRRICVAFDLEPG